MSSIKINKIGITKVGTEIIVNAANEQLAQGGGVCGVIFEAAGPEHLAMACRRAGRCSTGSAVITPAFNLKAKYIVHAVGPIYKDGSHKEPQLLYGCYKKSLELAREYNCHSIGFPLISAGIFGYPVDLAWRKALQACNDFIKNNPNYNIDIIFAVIDDYVLEIGNKTLNDIGVIISDVTLSEETYEDNSIETVDCDKLQEAIEHFCMCKLDGRVRINASSNYIQIMDPDYNYKENYDKYCKNVLPTDMNESQIQTLLTYLLRADHFGYDYLSVAIQDGTVLKCLLRLDDLLRNKK